MKRQANEEGGVMVHHGDRGGVMVIVSWNHSLHHGNLRFGWIASWRHGWRRKI